MKNNFKSIIPIHQSEFEEKYPDFNEFKNIFQEKYSKKKMLKLLAHENWNISKVTIKLLHIKELNIEDVFNKEDIRQITIRDIKYFLYVELLIEQNNINFAELQLKFDRILHRLIVLYNLSFNFSLYFKEGVILDDKNKIAGRTESIYSHLDWMYLDNIESKWPVMKRIPFYKMINFLHSSNFTFDDNIMNKDITVLNKAINAFSKIFGSLYMQMHQNIIWSMIGIETIYNTDENEGVMNQIKSKIKITLGEPLEFKKKLNDLYSYRSKLFHGRIPISFNMNDFDDDFMDQYRPHYNLSAAILIASIRTLIYEKKTSFKFKYVLSN